MMAEVMAKYHGEFEVSYHGEFEVSFVADHYQEREGGFVENIKVHTVEIAGVKVDFDALPKDLQKAILGLSDEVDFD